MSQSVGCLADLSLHLADSWSKLAEVALGGPLGRSGAKGGHRSPCSLSEQVTHLDENEASRFRERLVRAHVRASNPGAGRVAPEIVLKRSFKDEDLFASKVPVLAECGAWRPTHQRRVRVAEPIQ